LLSYDRPDCVIDVCYNYYISNKGFFEGSGKEENLEVTRAPIPPF